MSCRSRPSSVATARRLSDRKPHTDAAVADLPGHAALHVRDVALAVQLAPAARVAAKDEACAVGGDGRVQGAARFRAMHELLRPRAEVLHPDLHGGAVALEDDHVAVAGRADAPGEPDCRPNTAASAGVTAVGLVEGQTLDDPIWPFPCPEHDLIGGRARRFQHRAGAEEQPLGWCRGPPSSVSDGTDQREPPRASSTPDGDQVPTSAPSLIEGCRAIRGGRAVPSSPARRLRAARARGRGREDWPVADSLAARTRSARPSGAHTGRCATTNPSSRRCGVPPFSARTNTDDRPGPDTAKLSAPVGDAGAVGREAWPARPLGHQPRGAAERRHQVGTTALSFRSEHDLAAVGRDVRIAFVGRVVGEPQRQAAGRLLNPQVEVVATGPRGRVGQQVAVARHGRPARDAGVEGELRQLVLRRGRRRHPAACDPRGHTESGRGDHPRQPTPPGRGRGGWCCRRWPLSLRPRPRGRRAHRRCRASGASGSFSRHRASRRRSGAGGSHRQRSPVGLPFEDRRDRVGHRRAGERPPAGEHLVEHTAEGPDVGAPVHRRAARLLRAHVGRGAEHHTRRASRPSHVVECVTERHRSSTVFASPKSSTLIDTVGREADVGGLEIAVDDAALVGRVQGVDDLPGDGAAPRRSAAARQRSAVEPASHRSTSSERRRFPAAVGVDSSAVNRCDVRVVERGQQPRLALEARQRDRRRRRTAAAAL